MARLFASRAIIPCLLLTVAVGGISGCATNNAARGLNAEGVDEAAQFAASKPTALAPLFRKLYRDGEWNAVLNFDQLGLAAMSLGEYTIAEKAFDQAILRIDAIYADDPNAKKALSVFNEEKVKDFKGEPYERAMTYFYRGVLYARSGDFQNARAAFLAADLQGAMSQAERYDGDFGLMKYAAGWSSICDGDVTRGKALIEDAKKADKKIAGLPDVPGSALLLIDTGLGPTKVGVGQYKEAIGFVSRGNPDNDIVVRGLSGSLVVKEWAVGGDVYVQASTRGGRPVDAVLDGKAQFKDATNTAGNVALVAGAAMMSDRNSNVQAVGAIVALVGLVAKGVAYATTPAADLRQWSSLPATVLLFTGDVKPEPGITITSAVNGTPVLLPVQASNKGCWIGWGRTRLALAIADGGTADLTDTRVEYADRDSKNVAFRANLRAEFPSTQTAAAPIKEAARAQ